MSEEVDSHGEFTDKRKKELREAFDLYDRDAKEYIPKDEVGTVMRALGRNPTKDQLEDLIKEVDADDSGEIDFAKFETMMKKTVNQEKISDDVFSVFEREGYTVAQLRHVMTKVGDKLTVEEVNEMLKDVGQDPEHDGDKINFPDLVKKLTSGR